MNIVSRLSTFGGGDGARILIFVPDQSCNDARINRARAKSARVNSPPLTAGRKCRPDEEQFRAGLEREFMG
jgi:hypothetical protein